jgi:hypothetical protein
VDTLEKLRNLENSQKKQKKNLTITQWAQIIIAIRSIIFSKKLPTMPL